MLTSSTQKARETQESAVKVLILSQFPHLNGKLVLTFECDCILIRTEGKLQARLQMLGLVLTKRALIAVNI